MTYDQQIQEEVKKWQIKMSRKPNALNALSKKVQVKLNSFIPERIHKGITAAIKQMVRGVLFGSKYTIPKPVRFNSFRELEENVLKRIDFYKKTAAAEGGITGAGGFLSALADFPILLSIKLKLLFDIATMYGFDVKDYKERLYILHIFQLAFSSQQHRRNIFKEIIDWEQKKQLLPDDIHNFDWRNFQQEYRDYIDIAKLAQMIPGIGAVVGVVVNYKLINTLGVTAMNAYRMRLMERTNSRAITTI
jgi:hypothetical protein